MNITRTIETLTFTVALYSYLNGATCETVERTFVADEKKAKRELAKEFGNQPWEIIHTERVANKYTMPLEVFMAHANKVEYEAE